MCDTIDAGHREVAPLDEVLVRRTGDGVQIGDLHVAAELQRRRRALLRCRRQVAFDAQPSRSQRQVRRLRDVRLQDRQVECIQIERKRGSERCELHLASALQQRLAAQSAASAVTFIFAPGSLLSPATVIAIGARLS